MLDIDVVNVDIPPQDFNTIITMPSAYLQKIIRDMHNLAEYIEIKNVNGDKGWLYGQADYFAFELDDYWVLVKNTVLRDFIADKCKAKEICERPELYKLYTRNGRMDMVTLVKTIDLVYVCETIIKK